jgi:opacity protein-like surface antigen
MKSRFGVLFAALLLVCGVSFAQESHTVEVTGDYSYFRFYPNASGTFDSHSLNGGGGDITLYLTKMFGIKGDFQGYQSYSECLVGSGGSACFRANLFTYMGGPVVKFHISRFEPYAEVLLGGAHSNFYTGACILVACASTNPSNNAFALAFGGGIDIPLSEHVAFKLVNGDYLLTHFGDEFSNGHQSQRNFRVQTGIQFRF